MADSMIEATLGRLTYLVQGCKELAPAVQHLSAASGLIAGTGMRHDRYAGELASLSDLVHSYSERLEVTMRECARQLGWQVATYDIAPVARESGNEPIAWLTGNSMMPPLREFGISNVVWNMDERDLDVWAAYVEGVEERLDELQVYLGGPEYDNSLYVVDLARFEYAHHELGDADDSEDDSLESEWRPISD